MTDREKLTKLIIKSTDEWYDHALDIFEAGGILGEYDREEYIADHLIAHGVTVSEWISVKERTPTEADGTVWVCLADRFPYNAKEPFVDAKHDRRITEAHYSEFSKCWYQEGAVFPDGVVTHWMEKPQPPKENNNASNL